MGRSVNQSHVFAPTLESSVVLNALACSGLVMCGRLQCHVSMVMLSFSLPSHLSLTCKTSFSFLHLVHHLHVSWIHTTMSLTRSTYPPMSPTISMPCFAQPWHFEVLGAHPSCIKAHAMPLAMIIISLKRPAMAFNGGHLHFKFQAFPPIRICTIHLRGLYMSCYNMPISESYYSRTTLCLLAVT